LISFIVAMDENQLIGSNNQMPWNLPNDLKLFKKITTGYTVVMGKNTYESIGKALPQRKNIVISKSLSELPDCKVTSKLEDILSLSEKEEVFIIGGAQIYNLFLPYMERLYLTKVHHTFNNGDTYFPTIPFENYNLVFEKKFDKDIYNCHSFSFLYYERIKN